MERIPTKLLIMGITPLIWGLSRMREVGEGIFTYLYSCICMCV